MNLPTWIDRCLPSVRKRRSWACSTGMIEPLEARQLLTAIGSDDSPVGRLNSGETSLAEPAHPSPIIAPSFLFEMDATPLPRNWQPRALPAPAASATLHALTDLPVLNSYPASSTNLYLDFNGHFQQDWGSNHNISTPVFSLDNDSSTFSDDELAAIAEIFARVAEDFSPFAINVTTVEPSDLGNGSGLRVAIGGRWEDWFGTSAGGVGLINSFTDQQPNVAYVFSETLEVTANIAEAASHEAGHSFGLRHQSEYDESGNRVAEYYGGNSTGAPIMGSSYYSTRGRWWLGTSNSASNIQDDLAVLSRPANGFGYRTDDHGNSFEDATALEFAGTVATGSGVVEQMDDVDVFRFEITAEDQYRIDYRAARFGANLDVHLELRTADGTLLDERTTVRENALALGRTLVPGSYQIVIQNDGTYGSLGQYSIEVRQGNDPSLPPTLPGHFAGQNLSPTTAQFTWIDSLGETSYVLTAKRKVGKRILTFSETLPADTSSYLLTGQGILTGWQFSLRAVNAVDSTESDAINLSEIELTAPENVSAVQVSLTELAVLWDAVPGATDYMVRIRRAGTPGTTLQTVTVDGARTEVIVTGLEVGVDYLINVIARNSLAVFSHDPVTAQIVADPEPTPLLPPAQVDATAPEPFVVHVSWSSAAGATLYQIQQRRGKEWITLKVVTATVVPGANQAVDILPDGDQLRARYRIVASNGTQSAISKLAKVRRPAPAWRRG